MPARINPGFLQVRHRYLFQEVAQPLSGAVIEAMCRAADDLSDPAIFHGYSPKNGYEWLREAMERLKRFVDGL